MSLTRMISIWQSILRA